MSETITIEALTLKGDGIGPDQLRLPRVLPGEEVTKDGKIVTPSIHRITPPCLHFKNCGACALQHASDDWVAGWKTDVIAQGLLARGIETEIRPIVTSPPATRRRATFHGRRTKKGTLVGFKMRASDTLIAVPDCRVLHPALTGIVPYLSQVTRDYGSRKGEIDFAVTLCETGIDLDVRGGRALEPKDIEALARSSDRAGLCRLSWEGEDVAIHAPPTVSFDGIAVTLPTGAFLQATQHGEDALWASVSRGLEGPRKIADLFAGCGTFALRAARGCEVAAFEGAADLIHALDQAWRRHPELKPVKSHVRDLFRRPLLPDELAAFEAIIIDPPRAGAEAQSQEIAASKVSRVCAVSCNPVSFARDAHILLKGGFRLDHVQPVDQFRWSPHVELAAQFTR